MILLIGDGDLAAGLRECGLGDVLVAPTVQTGIAQCLALHPGRAVVTADRHAPADVVAVAQALAREPGCLIIGRGRGKTQRRLARAVFAAGDPLCGLRGLPAAFLAELAKVTGEGPEYGLNVLLTARRRRWRVVEVPIDAIASRGSVALGLVLLRFGLSSLGCAALDLGLFTLLAHGGMAIGPAVALARAASSLLNFWLNRGFVFRSDRPVAVAILLYYLLVGAIGLLSYLATLSLATPHGLPLVTAKIIADSVLFVISYFAQRYLVFARRPPAAFITPAGAGIAIICFFLPWLRVSCLRHFEFTGLEIAQLKSVYWLVLAGEVAVVALWTLGKFRLLRRPALYVAAAALLPLVVIFAPVIRGERNRGLDLELRVGAYGTILGLSAALLGTISRRTLASLADRRRPRRTPPSSPPRSGSA